MERFLSEYGLVVVYEDGCCPRRALCFIDLKKMILKSLSSDCPSPENLSDFPPDLIYDATVEYLSSALALLKTSEITNLRIERLYPKDDDHSPEAMESMQRVDVESATTNLKPVSLSTTNKLPNKIIEELPMQSMGDNSDVMRTLSQPTYQREDIDTLSLESGDVDGWDQERSMTSCPPSVKLSKDPTTDSCGDGSRDGDQSHSKTASCARTAIEAAGRERNKQHVCPWCGKYFKHKGKFNIHICQHTGEKPYACEVCEKCFSQKSSLNTHRRIHIEEKPHKCPKCDKGFRRKSHLIAHSRGHSGETPFVCQRCGKSFSQKAYLTVHNRTHNDVGGIGLCGQSEMTHFISHQTEHNEEYVTSAQSGMTLSSLDCMEVGVNESNEHTSSDNTPSSFINTTKESALCLGSSNSPRRTTKAANENDIENGNHRKTTVEVNQVHGSRDGNKHHGQSPPSVQTAVGRAGEKPYACEFCEKCFSQKSSLNSHRRTHTEEKTHKCPTCDKGFHRKSLLIIHGRGHSGETPYECQWCGKGFTRKSSLTVHIRSHTGEKPYVCQWCGKGFIQKAYLTIHNRVHSGETPNVCQWCGKCFTQKVSLTVHNRVHTGETPYVCQLCGKSFTRKAYLIIHNRVHTGEKPYLCQLCGKGFVDRSGLINHTKTHTGEKPFVCHLCGMRFIRKNGLQFHLATHERQKEQKRLAENNAVIQIKRQ